MKTTKQKKKKDRLVNNVELKHFEYDSLKVSDYWKDLYEGEKKRSR